MALTLFLIEQYIKNKHKNPLCGIILLLRYLNLGTSPNISLYKQALVEMMYTINFETWHITMSPFHVFNVVMTLHKALTALKAEQAQNL